MADIRPSTYIIGIIIFTMFILGGLGIYGELKTWDDGYVDIDKYDSLNETFNQYDELEDEVTDFQDNIETDNPDFGAFGVINGLIGTAWQTLKFIISSFDFMDNAYNGLATLLGVPNWVGSSISLMVIVILAFAIYEAIFKARI